MAIYDTIAQRAEDPQLRAEALYQSALTSDLMGEHPVAIAKLLEVLPQFRASGLRPREASTLNRLGDLARKTGELEEAEAYFREALPIAESAADRETVVDILNNHGLLVSTLGRWEEAIALLEAAVPAAREIGSIDVEAALHHNIGQAWSRLGEYELSLHAYERSLELKRRLGSQRRIASTLGNMANVYFLSGDTQKGLATIHDTLKIWNEVGDKAGTGPSLALLGRMQQRTGDRAAARATYMRALPILEDTADKVVQGNVLTGLAEIDVEEGKIEDARARVDRALALSRDALDRRGEARALYVRALALRRADRIDEAIAAIEETLAVVEATRGAISRSDLRTSYLATVHAYYDLYVDLLLQAKRVADAFTASERARARSLLDALAESAAEIRKGVAPALLERQRIIQKTLNAKESTRAQMARSGKGGTRFESLTRDVDRLLQELREIDAEIRASSPAYASLKLPEPVTVKSVQSMLGADTMLVAYRLGAQQSHAWVVDADSVTVHGLGPAAPIDRAARNYHELLRREQRPAQKQLVAAGREVAELVLQPLRARLRGKRLVIIADGALQYVPFAALPMGDQPLLTRYELISLPSASVLDALRRQKRRTTTQLAVFADAVFTADDPRLEGQPLTTASKAPETRTTRGLPTLERLQFSRVEAEAIAHAAGERDVLEALDFDAAKQTLLSKDLRRFGILHFATHGVISTERPELSGLVLSLFDARGRRVDGFLRLHEIYNLDLDARLVVLSACETALGKEVHGEGLVGLIRGFLYAGSTGVVASLWKVDDRATAVLMSRFYRAMLADGLAPAAALRKAQLSMLTEKRWRDPHDWASFGLLGDWR